MAIISVTSTSVAVNPLKQSQTVGAVLAFLGLKGMMPLLHGSQGCTALTKAVLAAILILKKNQRKFRYLNGELVSKHHFLTDNYHPTLEIERVHEICP